MRDVTIPYRAVPEDVKPVSWLAVVTFCLTVFNIVAITGLWIINNQVRDVAARLAATEACLQHLHITMTRLDNPGPERGANVATVSCKGE